MYVLKTLGLVRGDVEDLLKARLLEKFGPGAVTFVEHDLPLTARLVIDDTQAERVTAAAATLPEHLTVWVGGPAVVGEMIGLLVKDAAVALKTLKPAFSRCPGVSFLRQPWYVPLARVADSRLAQRVVEDFKTVVFPESLRIARPVLVRDTSAERAAA